MKCISSGDRLDLFLSLKDWHFKQIREIDFLSFLIVKWSFFYQFLSNFP